ncbi:hypothetical protein DPMN_103003 [Dreissena polymorpha]|uniref:Uncharacterized protein n=1 Tax=Dreissena polymorpha TaxID=45954 RepID=A0A9D4JYT3_DREPO|nr:hypothetical protein DPMN_103003 [Dreissena polymorpha]
MSANTAISSLCLLTEELDETDDEDDEEPDEELSQMLFQGQEHDILRWLAEWSNDLLG